MIFNLKDSISSSEGKFNIIKGGGEQASIQLNIDEFNSLIKDYTFKDIIVGESLHIYLLDEKYTNIQNEDNNRRFFIYLDKSTGKPQIKKSGCTYRKNNNRIKISDAICEDLKINNEQYNQYFSWIDRVIEKTIMGQSLNMFINDSEFLLYTSNDNLVFNDTSKQKSSAIKFKQIIYAGPPGTGKSFEISKEVNEKFKDNFIKKIVFYPSYEYYNFVGSIQPIINEHNTIEYKFLPGDFTQILLLALKNPEEPCALVIDELSRGDAQAIFGDIFQLLDRNADGNSEYGIYNDNIIKYINEECNDECYDKIIIPNNLSIYATLNTSDQNVNVIDSAFTRRFDYKYIGTDVNFAADKDFELFDGINWSSFYQSLNSFIIDNCDFVDDKLIGPFFIKGLDEKEKIIIHLFKEFGSIRSTNYKSIFNENINTIQESLAQKDNPEKLFSKDFFIEIRDDSNSSVDYLQIKDEDDKDDIS